MADSLTSRIEYDEKGTLGVSKSSNAPVSLQTGRRLILFGPEGFREAPRDYRLVIIMGTDPSKYFQSVSDVMSKVAAGGRTTENSALVTSILLALTKAESDKDDLQRILDGLPAQPATPQ